MSTSAAPSAASQYVPANAAIQRAATNATGLAVAPQTYQFDPSKENATAALLAKAQVLQNNQALMDRSPQAFAGQESAINDLTGGVAGDDAFLRNAALKSGLQGAASTGAFGPGSRVGANSAGGVTAEKIYGSDLLNYRNSRDQQALGIARSIQPDAAISPAMGVGQQIQMGQQQVQNQNDWNNFLTNSRLGNLSNLQNQTQQQEGLTQANYNAQADAKNAATNGTISAGLAAASTVAAAVIL